MPTSLSTSVQGRKIPAETDTETNAETDIPADLNLL